jgi:hypothetical protein
MTALAGMAYNWAYFTTLDAAGLMQFLSITDEISSALTWLPSVLITYVGNVFVSNISKRSIQTNAFWYRIIIASWTAIIVFIFGQLGFWFSSSPDYQVVIAMAGLLWISVVPRLMTQFAWEAMPNSGFFFYIAPMLLFLIIAAGNRAGLADLGATKGDVTITIKGVPEISNIRPIRYLTKGVIYSKPDKQEITYTRWDGGVSITMRQAKIEQRFRICDLLNILCSPRETVAAPSNAPAGPH